MIELSTREKREKEKGSFAAVFFSDQQSLDHVFLLTNRWIGLKFGLGVPDILVVDLNGGDRIQRSSRQVPNRSWIWVVFLSIYLLLV